MDSGAKKILESVTIKTLHAHNFSRSSTQANQVLTELLSRYLTLFASTCAKYAEHAGRLRLSVKDAVHAMDELGTSVEELSEYCATEGKEMARYAVQSTKRIEDLNEFRGMYIFRNPTSSPLCRLAQRNSLLVLGPTRTTAYPCTGAPFPMTCFQKRKMRVTMTKSKPQKTTVWMQT